MVHPEGMHISLIDESLLDSSGILTGNVDCASAYGLPDESVQLFLLIAAAGDDGLAKSRVPADLRADLTAHLIPLELQSLVTWERDPRGQLTYLVLTWKGQDALAAAKAPRQVTATTRWNARRRSVNG